MSSNASVLFDITCNKPLLNCLIHSLTKGGFKGDFFAVNNFVTPPDPEASAITNTQKFLSERLTSCANFNGKRPNFVYVDFWGEGVTSQLVQYANKQMASQKEKEEQKERS